MPPEEESPGVMFGRLDERVKAVERDVREIKALLQGSKVQWPSVVAAVAAVAALAVTRTAFGDVASVPRKRARGRRPVKWWLVRRYVYGVAATGGAALVYFKLLDPNALPVLLLLVLALFNTNPPPTPDEGA